MGMRFEVTSYSLQRLFSRGIKVDEALAAIQTGEQIATHRQDSPRPSRTFLLWVERPREGVTVRRPIHVVCATDPDGVTRIITAYWPDEQPDLWDAEFRRRIK